MAIVSSPSLQLQAGFTGTLSECLHATLIDETAAVVDHFGNALFEALLSDCLADFLSGLDVAAVSVKAMQPWRRTI